MKTWLERGFVGAWRVLCWAQWAQEPWKGFRHPSLWLLFESLGCLSIFVLLVAFIFLWYHCIELSWCTHTVSEAKCLRECQVLPEDRSRSSYQVKWLGFAHWPLEGEVWLRSSFRGVLISHFWRNKHGNVFRGKVCQRKSRIDSNRLHFGKEEYVTTKCAETL